MSNYLSLQIKKIANIELSRRDAWEFCLYYDYELFSKRPFLKIIAYSFQWLVQQDETPQHVIDYVKKEAEKNKYYYSGNNPKKIGISLPPRAGKSYVISVCCAWALGKYPTESIMRNACTENLYRKFSYDVRSVFDSDRFKDVFPNIQLSPNKAAVDGWNTNKAKQVSYFGAGVGGTIIGFGASLLAITDDLYKSMIDALSTNTIEKVQMWKESAHDTRLERNCPQLDIGTRWSTKDILGITEEKKGYDLIIRISALNEKNESFCDHVKTTKEYLDIKKNIDDQLWDAGYQQFPAELKGACFPMSKLKRFKLSDIDRRDFDLISLNYTDVADGGGDYLCGPIGVIMDGMCYVVDVVNSKNDSDYTHPALAEKYKKWNVLKGVFESNGQGLQYTKNFKKELKEQGLDDFAKRIIAIPNSKNKHSRIIIQASWIMNNMSFLDDSEIEENTEYKLYLKFLCDYMKDKPVKPDDQADATAGLSILAQKYM